ncbi:MAG: hypothetical protein OXP66_06485 [Candidatus Tectomicrobia bacterium]|nr:hypothetical protein [Candidatus Tectomicrobia bacterium]
MKTIEGRVWLPGMEPREEVSRVLLVKGMSWAYEKEVRLLVDLEQAPDRVKSWTAGPSR